MRIHFIHRFAVALLLLSAAAAAQIQISVSIAPPELPEYAQPVCPGDGYMWTPGYWAWSGNDFYFVQGEWVLAPQAGYLWTPAYWGWNDGGYLFHPGYWATSVGFYGGVDYGYGYFGQGYQGGRWTNGRWFYNSAVNHLPGDERNVYDNRVADPGNRTGYSGGQNRTAPRPTSQEEAASNSRHLPATAAQTRQYSAAAANPSQRFTANHGAPPAAPKADATHVANLPPVPRLAAPNTGNAKLNQQYQKQQDTVAAQQTKERQNLQAQQSADHQKLAAREAPTANDPRTQQLEQQHQQQTQQLQQRQTQQVQQLQKQQTAGAKNAKRGPGRG